MSLAVRTVYEVEADEEHHGLTPAEAQRLVADGLVYLGQTTHTFVPIPGREGDVRDWLANRGTDDDVLERHGRMAREHEAWAEVVVQLRERGVGAMEAGEKDERLHDAIVLWGEELAQLRMHDPDPDHATNALAERRAKYQHQ